MERAYQGRYEWMLKIFGAFFRRKVTTVTLRTDDIISEVVFRFKKKARNREKDDCFNFSRVQPLQKKFFGTKIIF